MCRHKINEMMKDSDTPIPTISTVENAILPCLQVHDLAWDDIPWPADVLDSLQNDGPFISLASRKPLSFWGAGNVFLYDFKPWDSKKLYSGTLPR
jgi:hypothetical protein